MRLPYIRYVETLILTRLDLVDVRDKTEHLGIAMPVEIFKMVYQEISRELPGYFSPEKPAVDPDYLEEKGIEAMYGHLMNMSMNVPMHGIKGALRLAEDPIMYRYITSLALARINDEDIELIVGSKFNPDYSVEDIQTFLHYFFDVSDWSVREKQQYVKNVTDPQLAAIYNDALKHDKEYIMWKLGGKADLSIQEIMKDMVQDSYYNFKEKSKLDPNEAQKWGSLAVRIADKLERIENTSSNSDQMFAEVEFKIKKFANPSQERSVHISDIDNDVEEEDDE